MVATTRTIVDGTLDLERTLYITTHARLAADAVSHSFWITPDDGYTYTVTGVTASWGTADSTATTATLMVQRCQGTEAPGSGDNLLAAVIDASGTANTPVTPALTTTIAHRTLEANDRLALVVANGATELADLTVRVTVLRNC